MPIHGPDTRAFSLKSTGRMGFIELEQIFNCFTMNVDKHSSCHSFWRYNMMPVPSAHAESSLAAIAFQIDLHQRSSRITKLTHLIRARVNSPMQLQ
ncbi:hypothetical protein CDAR_300041 [Caerostris darwini]|uniref:Uncharacterized protein n=1 Tax=Caerostris darwini TaxID=1538125 RepID=A0AAV4W378_9ARAC|nr:hypothetical protein CDAR_300041 [Caerostris darwini]